MVEYLYEIANGSKINVIILDDGDICLCRVVSKWSSLFNKELFLERKYLKPLDTPATSE